MIAQKKNVSKFNMVVKENINYTYTKKASFSFIKVNKK